MAAALAMAVFGSLQVVTLVSARIPYAMARDGIFFSRLARVSPRTRVPVTALLTQAVWAVILVFSGSYDALTDYAIFAVLIFYILTIVGLFVLRRTRPDAVRPYKAFGYPVLPALYIVMATWISAVLLRYKPQYT